MCCSQNKQPRSPKSSATWQLWSAVLSALILASAGYSYWNSAQTAKATHPPYTQADVATERPFKTGHDHSQHLAPKPIPFLPKHQPQPQLTLSEAEYDFGSVGPTEVVTRTFVIHNTGKGTLTISRAFTTCGCTTAEFSSTVIPPGKVSLVTVKFDAGFHDTRGQTVKRGVIIEANDPNQPTTEIWLKASVRKN